MSTPPQTSTPSPIRFAESYRLHRPGHAWHGQKVIVAFLTPEIRVIRVTALALILQDLAKGKTPAEAIKLTVTPEELRES
jgi:hypothetical protein